MQYSYKKSYKNFSTKSKTYGPDNYNYNPPDNVYPPNTFYKPNNPYNNYAKPKKFYKDFNNPQPGPEHFPKPYDQDNHMNEYYYQEARNQGQNERWQHDKYVENPDNPRPEQNRPGNKYDQKSKIKGDKRPDRQLYSARDKHNHGDETKDDITISSVDNIDNEGALDNKENPSLENVEKNNQTVTANSNEMLEKGDQVSQTSFLKGVLGIGEDKEEDKSFVSNVSTAISDKLKNHEDEALSREKSHINIPVQKSKSSRVLFQIALGGDKYAEKIKIYEEEEDYESMLDRICKTFNMVGRASLYFKINLLKMIHDVHPNRSKVEPILEKYVALNAKLLLYEYKFEEAHDSIKQYIDLPQKSEFQ